ncbi:PepSY domain-containing protein [Ureibacillus chungkukjangi]|uniref:Peptidase YpeB-like protein n=1 Tax=Ureibacillus chungkukjangi TaxID=1202712 RepID=A0A318TL70_9BACL|nr:PepSY domain-containing protein [Ureibacillus chungkukjangi]MCM3389416.1 PepSY domain-containing protein [Ureibacillus chungkukjangi]PYF05183.1 peptidase YpeB-like protein [Ureibacillus chungkukjangi]
MKKIILVPALLGIMSIGGVIAVSGDNLVGSANSSKELTKNEIEKKALAEVDGKITEIELEKEGAALLYEVEIVTADAEHDLKFNALTGELLKKTKDDIKKSKPNTNINSNSASKDHPVPYQYSHGDDDDFDDQYDDDDFDDDDWYDDDFDDNDDNRYDN